ncbi:MAG: hypothetical protein US72_C0002G0055 [Microgenomates group bacterium GW2011_GWC1_38_12]|nr:MAG: hypothetical protein US72_C0002G0055 [Microgenomates group bacterium GW2011_GWC1_38_12]KKS78161.1 MAG: hypothetical protein UV50_C0001G0071 [Parcubacteria group bacterium GW2011_GWB1_42_9]
MLNLIHMEKHPLHLKNPELQTSPEVDRAVERQERRTDQKVPNDPTERIEAYLDRLENIFLNPDERKRERNLEMFRDKIYDTLVIKPEQVPESYFELQKQVAREHGQAIENIPLNVRDQMIETIIADQKHSLDQWIDYLTSEDVAYPPWFKYLVWRNVIKLSQFDKTLGKFKDRTESTVAPYPDIYRAPLAKILDIYEQAIKDKTNLRDSEVQANFSKRFAKLYAELISESLAVRIENKEEVKGVWVKYSKGNMAEADKLFESVQAKGTGWCVEGRTTAQNYIKQGDFYVYYTEDNNGLPTQPRMAIQMNGTQIGQIRGVLNHQELEPIMADVLETKLKEFGPEADSYQKKNSDMKKMTAIEKKSQSGIALSKDDLVFLYEIGAPIEGFGYDRDPRIAELRQGRNPEEDMMTIFECAKEQIAHSAAEIDDDTIAYVGPWNVAVYQIIKKYPQIQHLYESFPDQKIFMMTQETDQRINSLAKAEEVLKAKNIYISNWAQDILQKTDFSREAKTYKLVQFTVEQLGFSSGATTDQIYAKAQELGLKLCPAEVGPRLRLQYDGKDWKLIAMKQITDRGGLPSVFYLLAGGGQLGLYADDAHPDRGWGSGRRFVFLS